MLLRDLVHYVALFAHVIVILYCSLSMYHTCGTWFSFGLSIMVMGRLGNVVWRKVTKLSSKFSFGFVLACYISRMVNLLPSYVTFTELMPDLTCMLI